jgi:anti-sigma factor RsiW
MTCEAWRDKLDAYVDSEGSRDEMASVETHLVTCSSCATEALRRMQMKRMTQAAATRYLPSPEFLRHMERTVERKPKSSWVFSWMPRTVAVAIGIILIAATTTIWLRHSARELALAELLDVHVATLASANPVDVISTDRHTVKPWFQGKVPFTFNLPELQNSSFQLVGGRVVYFRHSPGAELLFKLRNHQLSVFVLQDRPGMLPLETGVTTARELAFSVETWSEAGLCYVVISDANAADVHELGELLRVAARS